MKKALVVKPMRGMVSPYFIVIHHILPGLGSVWCHFCPILPHISVSHQPATILAGVEA